MATCWPRQLPHHIVSDRRRTAEISVFNYLSNVLEDSWSVYYSRPWWGLDNKGSEIDGEADFIVAHPELGILFIEVKGGQISYDPAAGKWRSKDRIGITHTIKDPALQALASKHQYLAKLKKISGWPKGFVRLRHGVIFPDTLEPTTDVQFIGGYERLLFCFAKQLDENLAGWIEFRLQAHDNKNTSRIEIGPGKNGLAALNKIIAEPVTLTPSLAKSVQAAKLEIELHSTTAQAVILCMLEQEPQFIVEGGAGTGKTVLAREIAIREAKDGKVIFVCRSESLIDSLRHATEGVENLTFLSCREFINKVETGVEFKKLGWSSLIIDEAQDFEETWWTTVEQFSDYTGCKLRIFGDSNQSVYRLRANLRARFQVKTFPLSINLRNTKSIADLTNHFYQGPLIQCVGPAGDIPTVIEFKSTDLIDDTLSVVLPMLKNEPSLAEHLCVLTIDNGTAQSISVELKKHRIAVQSAGVRQLGHIIVDSIANFKGLEADIVILVLDKMSLTNEELAYVGISRARSKLFLCGNFDSLNSSVLRSAIESLPIKTPS
jgi:hypothetical protein